MTTTILDNPPPAHEAVLDYTPDGNNKRQWPALLPVEEAAEALGMTVPSLRRYARRGTIPCVKVGRTFRFHLATVRKLIKQGV
jgi:excisionase family DNA binding protein